MKKIEMEIECPSCAGTGVYQGMAEGTGTAVVCNKCNGTAKFLYKYQYNEFTGRKRAIGVKQVYLPSRYKLGLGKIVFANGIGEIDMDKEGVSYEEFLEGKMPEHIKALECPVLANQGACHNLLGFLNMCEEINGSSLFGKSITDCKNQPNKLECWKRFERGQEIKV